MHTIPFAQCTLCSHDRRDAIEPTIYIYKHCNVSAMFLSKLSSDGKTNYSKMSHVSSTVKAQQEAQATSAQNGTLGSRGTQTDRKDVAYTTVEEVDDGCELRLVTLLHKSTLLQSTTLSRTLGPHSIWTTAPNRPL